MRTNRIKIWRTKVVARRLIRKHQFQIVAGPNQPELANTYAIVFRPTNRTDNFNGELLRQAGTSVMVVLMYRALHPGGSDHMSMPLRGYRSRIHPDGSVKYGAAGRTFSCDGALLPRIRGGGRTICPLRNPRLASLLLRLDSACRRLASQGRDLFQVPQFPKVLLGFPPHEPPEFEDSTALRELAANEIGVPVGRLGGCGSLLLDRLLHDVWERQLIPPSAPNNSTGSLLVDVDTSQNFNQYFPAELIERFEIAMREAVGPSNVVFSTEEILDGFTNPNKPLIGFVASLPKLRAKLAMSISECVTSDDLLRAARRPTEPLIASGACRIQALTKPCGSDTGSLHLTPEFLGRRIAVELRGDSPPIWPLSSRSQPTAEESIVAKQVCGR